ncbi:MAG TPA: DUF1540 domain-containing protein [Bacillota bacterium]|nr:DUF1540 domain-containing protein [Bacillota bacterium]
MGDSNRNESPKGIYLDDIGGEPQHINGISCDCKNCVYHEDECFCTASRVSVGTTLACCSSETVCATFKPRSDA